MTVEERMEFPMVSGTGEDDDDIMHLVCVCDEDISFCGFDMTGRSTSWDDWDESEITCVVCFDQIDAPCPRCGRT